MGPCCQDEEGAEQAIRNATGLKREFKGLEELQEDVLHSRTKELLKRMDTRLLELEEVIKKKLQPGLGGGWRFAPPKHSSHLRMAAAFNGTSVHEVAKDIFTKELTSLANEAKDLTLRDTSGLLQELLRRWSQLGPDVQSQLVQIMRQALEEVWQYVPGKCEAVREQFRRHKEAKKWQRAKESCQELQFTCTVLMSLEETCRQVCVPFETTHCMQLLVKKCGCLRPSEKAVEKAESGVSSGEFEAALEVWCSTQCHGPQEQRLVDSIVLKITDCVDDCLVSSQPRAGRDMHQQLSSLKRFLEAVGDDPPPELDHLCQDARRVVDGQAPSVDQALAVKADHVVEAAQSTNLDQLVASLTEYRPVQEFATQEKRREVEAALASCKNEIAERLTQARQYARDRNISAVRSALLPIQKWKDVFDRLTPNDQQLLSESLLQNSSQTLSQWMRLTVLGSDLFEHRDLERLCRDGRYSEVSDICELRDLLAQVFGGPRSDLSAITQHLDRKASEATRLLGEGSLEDFGPAYKALRDAAACLPEHLGVGKFVQKVEKALDGGLLERLAAALCNAQSPQEAQAACLNLRSARPDLPVARLLQVKI